MLHLHRAERADHLVDALADVVVAPLADPLAGEVVAVPTRGVERWLSQRLASRLGTSTDRADGVCANVEFPFPGRLIGGVVADTCEISGDTDPWAPERALWPLLQLTEERLDHRALAPLAAHLRAAETGGTAPGGAPDEAPRRRLAVVRHLADLYDRYGVHRPWMLRAWADGADVDASGVALGPDVAWQAELWRALRERLAVPSPAERLADATEHVRTAPDRVDVPDRVSLFGLTRLPSSYLHVLSALAVHRDVHLFLLHPSPALWQQVASVAGTTPGRRADAPRATLPQNPLLASWGADSREMQLVLSAASADRREHHHASDREPESLLTRLQVDVRDDRAPRGAPLPGATDERPVLSVGDNSLQVHACHGRARQVEVARDAILHLLAEDPTLEPRDVIVMCPDIETFAPLIHVAFDAVATGGPTHDHDAVDNLAVAHPGPPSSPGPGLPDLHVRVADRSLRQTNAVLGVVEALLSMADDRVTASQVSELAGRGPVRRRFGFDDDDLERLEGWIGAVAIRWGFDARHRAPWKLDAREENTWRSGLARLLLGAAMSEDGQRLVGGVLPHDDVEGGDIAVLGRFAELLARLETALAELRAPQPVDSWAAALGAASDALTATGEADAWQHAQLHRMLDEVVAEATIDGRPAETPLSLPEVRALLADRLRGRPTRANFRTGHLTVCTLVPMRSVPHRVVCLLGLDDGAFPRRTIPDGDDLVDRDPHVGDRNPRAEDRQLLLDALLAASDHLVVTYTGHDERSNAPRPPAVPVGELLDTIDRSVRHPSPGASARDHVVRTHPLQPFDPRNFADGEIAGQGPWSFDAVALAGARALSSPRGAADPFLPERLPPPDEHGIIELDDLVRFVQHPAKAFLHQRLGISLATESGGLEDALPVELDGLERWRVGQRLLEARLEGLDQARCVAAERARGLLPPGALAAAVLEEVLPPVEQLVAATADLAGSAAEGEAVDVSLGLPSGVTLVGTVTGLAGDTLWSTTYSRLAPKHRLAAWVRLLAVAAARPDARPEGVTVGRSASRSQEHTISIARIRWPDVDPSSRPARALDQLGLIADLHQRGMREPLPVFCATSAAYAIARAKGSPGVKAAEDAWASTYDHDGEDRDPEHRLVLGGQLPLERLLSEIPRADETGPGWADDEASRFGRYARRLWDGLLEHEGVTHR